MVNNMTQYINKSALVAEIKDKINLYEEAFKDPSFASYEACLIAKGKYRKLLDILQFINSLKVKEVDLEKEIELIKGDYEQVNVAWNNDFDYIARHFFELGLKAMKGE